ncbi:MAG: endolytic transglycosylase MltG [Bryobacteraceae bacterium]
MNPSRKRKRPISLLAIAALLAAAAAGYWFFGPYRGFGAQTFVDIEHGVSSRAIARDLVRHGVVRSHWAFLAIRALHPGATLQAGEYRFAAAETPWAVFEKIRRGKVFFQALTVPEGSNVFDISDLLKKLDSVTSQAFLSDVPDTQTIRDLDPLAPNLEGYLFPSTYRITHTTTAKRLCRMMTGDFRKTWASLGGPSNGDATHRIVTIASLIEKETAIPEERPLIASVFYNRLRLGMPLQCDPTAVYAALLDNRYTGVISKSDLASKNPYNTYMHPGLPPGPICNPGRASLEAALHPAKTDYLYFVAKPDGSGRHTFSTTLAEHLKAVLAYRMLKPSRERKRP